MKNASSSNQAALARPALFALAALLAAAPLHAEAPFTYVARIGLYSTPEFTSSGGRQSIWLQGMTASGVLYGKSERFLGQAYPPDPFVANKYGNGAWVAKAATGVTHRVGLYDAGGGTQFTKSGGYQESTVLRSTGSGWVAGQSERFNGGTPQLGVGLWVANAATGATTRIGLYDEEFTSQNGTQTGQIDAAARTINEAGQVIGYSRQYKGQAGEIGAAAWIASGATGVTTRLGLLGEGYTASNGAQNSFASDLNATGYVAGESVRLSGTEGFGNALWIANGATGATLRVGLYNAGGGNEFTSSASRQQSSFVNVSAGNRVLSATGYAVGFSSRYNGGSNAIYGDGVWVASGITGTTRRIGLYDAGGGNEFTSSSGYQMSIAERLADAGKVIGRSLRFNGGSTDLGQGAWVADAATGATTRIGFYDAGGGNEFTSSSGYQFSTVVKLTESGYGYGDSWRYNGQAGASNMEPARGRAAWVVNAATGVTTRIGFTGAGYTSGNGSQRSGPGPGNITDAGNITESGYLWGYSKRYNGVNETDLGQAAWVARAATGATTRIGLYDAGGGNEFTSSSGAQSSSAQGLTESGYLRGHASRYNGTAADRGQAAWVADAATGETRRIGFVGAGYTDSAGYQFSETLAINESGVVSGSSARYAADSTPFKGRAAWLADAGGATTRVGLTDAAHTSGGSYPGYQFSVVTHLVDGGYAAGYSERYNGDAVKDGQTAWVYDLANDAQISLLFSVRPSDGYAFSSVSLLTETGVALGIYTLFDGAANLGSRAFAYLPGLGGYDIGTNMDVTLTEAGWNAFLSADFATTGRFIAGGGSALGASDSMGVYLVAGAAVPEPGEWGMLCAAALVFLCIARHRRRLSPAQPSGAVLI